MNLKTFTAESMPAVLAQVKQALGNDAVILHTRAFKRGGFLGIGAKTVVEVTAARGSEIGRAQAQRQRVANQNPGRPTPSNPMNNRATSAAAAAPRERQPAPESMMAGDLIRRTYLAAQAQMAQSADSAATNSGANAGSNGSYGNGTYGNARPTAMMPPPQQASALTDAVMLSRPNTNSNSNTNTSVAPPPPQRSTQRPRAESGIELADEVRVVKRMVAKMVRQQQQQALTKGRGKNAQPAPDMPNKLYDQYVSLLQQEVTDELAEEVMQQVRSTMKPEELEDDAKVKKAVFQAISKLVPLDASGADQPRAKDGRPLTIALIGPTGVGKTTTIAKLAANFKLREKKKVGLITIDTYRIAAVDQLRTYANIIGVPLHVIASPADMGDALAKCSNCDVILIDTAGRSQRDDPKLEQLNDYILAADPHEVHLVLSSTCTQSALFDVIDRFSQIRVDRIIFTKLDEAVTFGVLFNVARKVNKRLSYLTTGQEVPHQIEVGRSDRLASLVLGEGL